MHATALLFTALVIVSARSLLFHCPIVRHLVRAAYRPGVLHVTRELKVFRYSFLETIPNFLNWLLSRLLLVGSK